MKKESYHLVDDTVENRDLPGQKIPHQERLMEYPGGPWGDMRDGNYRNPVLAADYSDPDILQIGKDFFLITSTFVQSPGITVMHSEDLVNWHILGGAIKDIGLISPRYRWNVMQGYGRGIWAPCITYNPGNFRYFIHFGDPDCGMFMVETEDIFSGNWSDPRPVLFADGSTFGSGWDDCGVLWDDDGQGYFAVNHFADGYKNYLFRLDQNGYQLQDEGVLFHKSEDGMYAQENELFPEALKLLKKDGYYYIFHNGVTDGVRKAFLMRSAGIYGQHEDGSLGTRENPGRYEHSPAPLAEGVREPNQGNLIFVKKRNDDGKWYFWTHHGMLGREGRPDSLIPLIWEPDQWPEVDPAYTDKNGYLLQEKIPLPLKSEKENYLQTSDDFLSESLGPQWTWNFQPRDSFWSLTERPGFLRLKAFCPLKKDCINTAGNSLIQRMYREDDSLAEMKMDITGMADGQFAGLLYMAGENGAGIGVEKKNGNCQIRFCGKENVYGELIPDNISQIWLRAAWNRDMRIRSSYSLDGKVFLNFGENYQVRESKYQGGHIGIFNYNNLEESGIADIEWFHYRERQI